MSLQAPYFPATFEAMHFNPYYSCISIALVSIGGHYGLADAAPPHVLVILVDDMGYGDPGCYNSKSQIPTPNIDSLAREGLRFTDAHAPGPLCHMSRYGLLTGIYPFRTDVSKWPNHPLIKNGQVTIASLLRERGYRTAMVGKWHLGFEESGYDQPLPGGPIDRGFNSFFGIRASTDIPPYFYIRGNQAIAPPTHPLEAHASRNWSPIQGAFWRKGKIAPDMELTDVLPRLTKEAAHIIQDHAQSSNASEKVRPLFLYLALPAPHTPWLPSKEFQGRSRAGLYGDFAVMVDDMVGKVLTALEAAGMSDDTLVVFASDNGPTWYERDALRFGHDSAGGLRGMKADAWEAGHRMPLVMRWPRRIKPRSTTSQMFCFTDLLATLSTICDAPLPTDVRFDSHDFSPVITGTLSDSQPVRETMVIQSGNGTMTIRLGKWKLIEGLGSGGFSEPVHLEPTRASLTGQLFNLDKDMGESENLFEQKPEVVRRLTDMLIAERDRKVSP